MNEIRNPKFSAPEQATIDVEWNHPRFGWINFTASPSDSESHGREIYALALDGEFGEVAPYEPPDTPLGQPE